MLLLVLHCNYDYLHLVAGLA